MCNFKTENCRIMACTARNDFQTERLLSDISTLLWELYSDCYCSVNFVCCREQSFIHSKSNDKFYVTFVFSLIRKYPIEMVNKIPVHDEQLDVEDTSMSSEVLCSSLTVSSNYSSSPEKTLCSGHDLESHSFVSCLLNFFFF